EAGFGENRLGEELPGDGDADAHDEPGGNGQQQGETEADGGAAKAGPPDDLPVAFHVGSDAAEDETAEGEGDQRDEEEELDFAFGLMDGLREDASCRIGATGEVFAAAEAGDLALAAPADEEAEDPDAGKGGGEDEKGRGQVAPGDVAVGAQVFDEQA